MRSFFCTEFFPDKTQRLKAETVNEDIVVMFGLPMFGIANTHPDFARQSFTCEGDAGKNCVSGNEE